MKGLNKKTIIALSFAALLFCASLLIFVLTFNNTKVDGIKIIDKGCDINGVSVDIIFADFDERTPFLNIEWKNRNSKEYSVTNYFEVYVYENGN